MTYRRTVKDTLGVGGIVALSVVMLIVLVAGVWGASVLVSNIRGAGNAIKTKNSAVMRIGQQEQFEQLAADYDGYLTKISIAKRAVRDAAGDDVNLPLRQTELLGLRQTCVDAAQQFNANSRKFTARDWKSAGLPAQLDPTNCTEESS